MATGQYSQAGPEGEFLCWGRAVVFWETMVSDSEFDLLLGPKLFLSYLKIVGKSLLNLIIGDGGSLGNQEEEPYARLRERRAAERRRQKEKGTEPGRLDFVT